MEHKGDVVAAEEHVAACCCSSGSACEAFDCEVRENFHRASRALNGWLRLLHEPTFGGVAVSGTSGSAAFRGRATLEWVAHVPFDAENPSSFIELEVERKLELWKGACARDGVEFWTGTGSKSISRSNSRVSAPPFTAGTSATNRTGPESELFAVGGSGTGGGGKDGGGNESARGSAAAAIDSIELIRSALAAHAAFSSPEQFESSTSS